MRTVTEALTGIEVGPVVQGGLLQMYPLLSNDIVEPAYDLAGAAFAAGTLTVTEVSQAGAVPTLRVTNSGARPVLLLDGEELIGAKQNRVLNVTVMVPARQAVDVPVSCVEAGRWAYRSAAFQDANWLMDAELRARKMRNVSESMDHGSRAGDQRKVWDSLAEKTARMSSESATGAQSAMFEKHHASLEPEVDALRPVERQVGAVFAAHGCISGLEQFDAAQTFRTILPKLVRSHALDALDRARQRTAVFAAEDPQTFLQAVAGLPSREHPAVGLGREQRLDGPSLVGAGLIVDGRTVHLSVLAN